MLERLAVLAVLIVVVGIPVGVAWAKGHRMAVAIGFVTLGMVWVVAAIWLARPSSAWARRFYGPDKMARAERRFGE